MTVGSAVAFEEAVELGEPEHKRGAYDDDDPVDELQAHDVEELLDAGDFDHGNLTDEDYQGDCEQPVAPLEVQGAPTGLEGAGVEEVEEVCHHEDGEQQGQLVGRDCILRSPLEVEEVGETGYVGVLEDNQECKQQREEEEAHGEDFAEHRAVDYEGVAVTRSVFHDALRRWERSQGHGGESVHDEVDPEHLGDGERRLCAEECPH